MGASIGAALRACGVDVLWASHGRSQETTARADNAELLDVVDLFALAERCDVIICICPPAAATASARQILDAGFTGTYVDANAIAPATATIIGELVSARGASFVDGDLIGGPARSGGSTRLYLSGQEAPSVARLFEGSDRLDVAVLAASPEHASALKMCYAAWTKGSAALLIAIRSAAQALGVEEALLAEWTRSQPDLAARSAAAASSTAPKAWRFDGEMEQIALSFRDVGLPDDFHLGAAEVYRRLTGFKGRPVEADIAAVLAAVRTGGDITGRSAADVSWSEFQAAAPELAAFGAERLRLRPSYLATVRAGGVPRVHPVTPIITEVGLFVFMEPTSPKVRDLRSRRAYSLHSGVPDGHGTGGEFSVTGEACFVSDGERRSVATDAAGYTPADRYLLLELRVSEARCIGYGDFAPPAPLSWSNIAV